MLIGWNGLQVVACVVSVVAAPFALRRLWLWALRPDQQFDREQAALDRIYRRRAREWSE